MTLTVIKNRYFPEDLGGTLYLAGDGAIRNKETGYFTTWALDDVLNVSGHRMGTMEIESALATNPLVAEAASWASHTISRVKQLWLMSS